jgi:hypothetical protein
MTMRLLGSHKPGPLKRVYDLIGVVGTDGRVDSERERMCTGKIACGCFSIALYERTTEITNMSICPVGHRNMLNYIKLM